jgi:hypothetical protein
MSTTFEPGDTILTTGVLSRYLDDTPDIARVVQVDPLAGRVLIEYGPWLDQAWVPMDSCRPGPPG